MGGAVAVDVELPRFGRDVVKEMLLVDEYIAYLTNRRKRDGLNVIALP